MSKINETAEYTFVVKDASDFEFYITIEPSDGEKISIFENGMLSFYLKKGTSKKKAHEITKFLNENIDLINYQEIQSKKI